MADSPVVKAELRRAWQLLLPGHSQLGEELLEAWSAPRRRYHDLTHLNECLSALAALQSDHRSEYLALWFHDAVHTNTVGLDEQRSAELAETRLSTALPYPEVAEVGRLIRLTANHDPHPHDLSGERVCDADLAILGADPVRYRASVVALRQEQPAMSDLQWRQTRLARLDQLLSSGPVFRTAVATQLWGEQALSNLTEEIHQLQSTRLIN